MKTLDFDYSLGSIDFRAMAEYQSRVGEIHRIFHYGPRDDSGFGWLDYPLSYPREEFDKIIHQAGEIRKTSQAFIVIGIGGSYLGARAAIEMLGHSFHNLLPEKDRSGPEIYFAGNNVSGKYYTDLLEIIQDKDISICMISKSGDTTEPAIAFRLFRSYLEKKYGLEGAKRRIFIITDKEKGPLGKLAAVMGYQTFAIPQDIGGRYSVLTPVGMLPMAVAGIDILKVMEGAAAACRQYNCENLADNPCYQYGAIRNILQDRGMEIELLAYYEPSLYFFAQWWRQLFAESEGKEGKGLFTGSVEFVSELHSLGQLIQEGKRNIFETVLNIEKEKLDFEIVDDPDNHDGLDYLSGKKMSWIAEMGMEGTALAHTDGGVPNLLVGIPEISEYYFGQLVYFFKKACAMSCYLSGVNPFDQPGVEGYKGNMYALLGKPGYQEQGKVLRKRLEKNAQQRKL